MTTIPTKYRRQLTRAKAAIAKYGATIIYGVHQPEIHGQITNVDTRVEQEFRITALILRKSRRRDAGRFLQTHEVSVLLGGDLPFKPKPGDWIIDPQGKRLPVDDVRIVGPDGVPLLFRVRCIDG